MRWRLEYYWHGVVHALLGAMDWCVEKIDGPVPSDWPLQQEQDLCGDDDER